MKKACLPKLRRRRGFTLIELMVVIAIVMLLVAGSIMGIAASRERRQVKTTAEKLKYVITQAVSQAKTPDDSNFGLVKIEVDVYPHNSTTAALRNQVEVYNCFTTACTGVANREKNTKLSFKAPTGVYLNSSNLSTNGNMNRRGSVNFWYFHIMASENSIGKVSGINPDYNVFLTVADTTAAIPGPNDTVYKVIAYQSGLITSKKVQ